MSGIQRNIQRQKALQATTGVTHPSAKKYCALNDRVSRAGGSYGRAVTYHMIFYLHQVPSVSLFLGVIFLIHA